MIGPEDEAALPAFVRALPFREFEFHGYTGERRVVSFGWHRDKAVFGETVGVSLLSPYRVVPSSITVQSCYRRLTSR